MDLRKLKLFESVFRNRSFSRASEEMSLTQPTVSDHIISFEAELGCRLFDRLGRAILPTKEAEILYPYAVELIEKVKVVKMIMGQAKKDYSGELVVGASATAGSFLLPPMIASFRSKYPDIMFRIVSGNSNYIADKVISYELPLGIVGSVIPDEKLTYSLLVEDELIVIASPGFLKANSLCLEEFAALPFIMREEGSGTRREIEKILIKRRIRPDRLNIVGAFDSISALIQAVKSGIGVSIVSRFAALDHLKSGELKEIMVSDLKMKRHIYIVTHKKRTLSSAHRLFVEHLSAEVMNLATSKSRQVVLRRSATEHN